MGGGQSAYVEQMQLRFRTDPAGRYEDPGSLSDGQPEAYSRGQKILGDTQLVPGGPEALGQVEVCVLESLGLAAQELPWPVSLG